MTDAGQGGSGARKRGRPTESERAQRRDDKLLGVVADLEVFERCNRDVGNGVHIRVHFGPEPDLLIHVGFSLYRARNGWRPTVLLERRCPDCRVRIIRRGRACQEPKPCGWFRTLAKWRGFGMPRCTRPGKPAQPFLTHGVWPWSRQRASASSGSATPHATRSRSQMRRLTACPIDLFGSG